MLFLLPGGFQLCFRVHDNNLRDDCQRTVSACSPNCTREMRCSNSTLFCIKCHFMLTGIMSHQQLYKLPVQLLLSSQRFVKLPAIAFIQFVPCKKIASMERIMSLFSNECGSV